MGRKPKSEGLSVCPKGHTLHPDWMLYSNGKTTGPGKPIERTNFHAYSTGRKEVAQNRVDSSKPCRIDVLLAEYLGVKLIVGAACFLCGIHVKVADRDRRNEDLPF